MTIEIDHTSLSVSDYDKAKAFYAAALKPLRVTPMMEFPASVTGNVDVCGLGADGKPFLWLANAGKTTPRVHICFRAETRRQVDAFHEAAIAAGGIDNGPPGLRTMYHPNYYGAFVLDADGHNIEVVCHAPPASVMKKKPAARKGATRKAAGRNASPAKKPSKPVKKSGAKAAKTIKPAKSTKPTARSRPAPGRKPAGRPRRGGR